MKSIRKWRNIFIFLFIVNILLTLWFTARWLPEVSVTFGVVSFVWLIFLIRQMGRLYDARLICDNRLFSVPPAVTSLAEGSQKKDPEETVVSTFGILIGSKIYKWGCDGIYGVRLNAIEIDRTQIYLTFGDEDEIMQVELLNSMYDKQEVMEVKQRLWHETGITASIHGWEQNTLESHEGGMIV